MTHPSDVAVDYIFEIFRNNLIDNSLENYMKRFYKIHKALSHRAINKNSEEHIRFKEQTKNKAKQLFTEYPQSQKLKELFNF